MCSARLIKIHAGLRSIVIDRKHSIKDRLNDWFVMKYPSLKMIWYDQQNWEMDRSMNSRNTAAHGFFVQDVSDEYGGDAKGRKGKRGPDFGYDVSIVPYYWSSEQFQIRMITWFFGHID